MNLDVKIKPVLFTSYETTDNRHNVKIRISFYGKQKNVKTKYFFTKEEFDEVRGKTKTRIFSKEKREFYKTEFYSLNAFYEKIVSELKVVTLESINQALDKEKEKYKLELFYLLNKIEKERRDTDKISSANQYKEAASSLERVMDIKEKTMVDVTPFFLYDYEKRALEYGHSSTTINIYMRAIRYVWNYCINNDLLERQLYPFGKNKPKYKLITPNERKIALDTIDMNIFKDAKVKGIKQFYLDLFLFSYYTFGMNVIDILKLKKNDIYDGYIRYIRQKTASPIETPLRDEANHIMNKYNNEDSKFVFGRLKGDETPVQLKERSKAYAKRINKVLKEICESKNLTNKVTTYTARHTAANNLIVERQDIAFISQLLGHKDIKTTQAYLSGLPSYDIKERALKVAM